MRIEKAGRQTIKYTKKEEFFLHEFYKWLIKIDSSDATKIFCGVHNDVDLVKAKSKKRKANSRKEYYEQSIQVHYNSVTAQGKIEPITQVGSPPINLKKKKYFQFHCVKFIYCMHVRWRNNSVIMFFYYIGSFTIQIMG